MISLRELEAKFKARMHKALSFDGWDDYVQINDIPQIPPNPDNGSVSVLVWFKTSNIPPSTRMILFSDSVIELGLFIDTDRKLHAITYQAVGSQNVLVADEWYHAALVYDKDKLNLKLYINGSLQGERSITVGNGFKDPPFCVGCDYNAGSLRWFYKGLVSKVMIYNIALSKSEVKYLYHNPFDPIDLDSLVLWLTPASIDIANGKWWDLSGKGNHGTIYGATEVSLVEAEVEVL